MQQRAVGHTVVMDPFVIALVLALVALKIFFCTLAIVAWRREG